MSATASLTHLEAAQEVFYQHLKPTPEIQWPLFSAWIVAEVFVKNEGHTPIGAFKIMAGPTHLDRFTREHPKAPGIISVTRGNHGQSLAFACAHQIVPLTILVPRGNNPEKNAAMKELGSHLIQFGDDFQAARERAEVLGNEEGLHD